MMITRRRLSIAASAIAFLDPNGRTLRTIGAR